MHNKNKYLDKMIDILKQDASGIDMGDRIDGVYVGDNAKLAHTLFSNKNTAFIFIEVPKAALNKSIDDDTLAKLNTVNHNNAMIFYSSTKDEQDELFKIIPYFEYIDKLFIFNSNYSCIFSANDGLEDVTVALDFFNT